jgi:serine/threonine protein kinase/tetratricopeptide (TPR) repeat protein
VSLRPGTRIGNFEIVTPLGAGGMGEVYRARDTRLDRSVAIKALPQEFASDSERLARFEREAKLLASLNHPNVAGIYGLEDVDGSPHLVLEFVEGETLAARLARGPLQVREALDMGGQIASAIEAAHDRGIVHRDLKPGNVMLTPSHTVKVLDFGLAKGDVEPLGASVDPSESPTVALPATGAGVILGTAPYMSPEQARGLAVDRRTDVWAFGCVLYECLAGRQAFAGETASDVIVHILEREPDWSTLPSSVPTRLCDLVRRCLTKEASNRPRDIGDLRRELGAIERDMSSGSVGPASVDTTPSLAVLYFENMAADPESEYFCAGITEDILTDLSKIRGLRVASRNAVARYRGSPADISSVAGDLGVGAVLEGAVRRAGDRVRITTQLINAADGFQLWAERFDRTLEDVFTVQAEIAASIAAALRVVLTPAETEKLGENRPKDVRAYDLYLKGRERYGRYTAESLREALELFEQAIAIDPDYALAYAGVADCYGQMLQLEITDDVEDIARRGHAAARHATRLNPGLAEAYKAEALVLGQTGDNDGSRAALIKAIEANPRYTSALLNLAVHAFSAADLAGAERLVRRSLEIDPQEAFGTGWLAFLAWHTNRHDEVLTLVEQLRKLSDVPAYVTIVHQLRAIVFLNRGDLAAAAQAVRGGLDDGANPSEIRTVDALIAVRAGRTDEAKRIVQELENVRPLDTGSLTALAAAAVRLGDLKRAVGFMRRQIIRNWSPCIVRLHRDLHPLLDREPFAPRRWDVELVWPLEAPMIDPVCRALFREVRVESGAPKGSDVGLR